jgi:hypothetical protein
MANYYQSGDEKTNQQTMQKYERLQALIHAHFGQYGISSNRIEFTKNVGKKVASKGKVLMSFDIRTPGMDDVEGMEAAEEAFEVENAASQK